MTNLPIPSNGAELEELLNDKSRMSQIQANGQLGDVIRAYAGNVTKKDADISAQVREQVQMVVAEYYEKNGVEADKATISNVQKGFGGDRTLFNSAALGNKIENEFDSVAHYFQTIHHNTERTPEVMAKLNRLRNAYGSGQGSDGGFLVPESMRSEILVLSLENGVVRPNATVLPMSTPRLKVPSVDSTSNVSSVHGGITTYWEGEASSITESSSNFARIELQANKLTAYTEVPNELLRDGIAFEAFIRSRFPEALAFAEDAAFINGLGAGKPQGFLKASAGVSVTKETNQPADTIVWENIVKMYSRMLPESLSRAVWVVPPNAFPELATMALSVGTGGSAIWLNNGVTGPPMTILGRPVIVTEKAPTLGDAGDISFVDLKYYLIGDRQEMTVESSPHYKFQTDETAFKVVERVDGRLALNSAITPHNNGDTLSPVVKLGARA